MKISENMMRNLPTMPRISALVTLILLTSFSNISLGAENLLLNADFAFHSFDSSRTGAPGTYRSGAVPCWNSDSYGDIEVWRSTRTTQLRMAFPVDGVVKLRPGKRFSQFALLSELGLDHGDRVSLSVHGWQSKPEALHAAIHCMRLDNQSGTYSNPPDARVFPKHSRGELVRGPSYTATAAEIGNVRVKLENVEVVGKFTENADRSNDEPNTIGLLIEFTNNTSEDVWLYAPCVSRRPLAEERLTAMRKRPRCIVAFPAQCKNSGAASHCISL
ncbi:MAG: hypothetical protein JWM11_7795 [Planctomycetaceae bacterium]|nr:hypothetical protein [Planctomycetaceae bacterium]